MKFLVRWKLLLGPAQLRRISRTGLLQVGLDYVKALVSEGKVIGVYRFAREERGARVSQPSGIAIVEAESLEKVKKSIEDVPGLSMGKARRYEIEPSRLNYFEYEIEPLIELPFARKKEV